MPVKRPAPPVTARVEGGHQLVVSFNDAAARTKFEEIVDADSDDEGDQPNANDSLPFDDEGPNARGTYSKAYVVKHPEVDWVHRGQGRYLPATQARVITVPVTTE